MQNKIRDMWANLGKRDRIVLTGGMALALIILLVQFVLVPYAGARKKLTKSIKANEKILKEMVVLDSENSALRKGVEAMQSRLARRAPTFALLAHVEKKAGETGVRSNIKNMQPSRTPISGPYAESTVEIALEKITLKQLVGFLYAVESHEEMIRVKRLSIKKNADNAQYLNASIHFATVEVSGPEAAPVRGRS